MIVACSNCQKLYFDQIPLPDGGMILRRYTDGRIVTEVESQQEWVWMCSKCGYVTSFDDARNAKVRARLHSPIYRYICIRHICYVSDFVYIYAISLKLAKTPQEERLFRLAAWKKSNDLIRDIPDHKKPSPIERPAWWRANLEALKMMLDPGLITDVVLLAEIHRELSDYESCIRVVKDARAREWYKTPELHLVFESMDTIMSLAYQGVHYVARV
jgi:hypothetical protein